MAKVVFKNQSGSESELFPVNIFDKIPSHRPVCLVEKVVDSLVEMGYVSLDVHYIDETKIEARSNRYTFVWRSIEKNKAKLETKVNKILSDIESSIQSVGQTHEILFF